MKLNKNIINKRNSLKLLEFLVLGLYLCLIKVPFLFCREVSLDYFNNKTSNKLFLSFLYWGIEFLYILIVIWIILNIRAHKNNK